jgi:hypothetical protein
MTSNVWSKPYLAITHLGELKDRRRVSVQDYGSFATLDKWYEGCGFYPIEEWHETVEAAKAEGERWVNEIKVANVSA